MSSQTATVRTDLTPTSAVQGRSSAAQAGAATKTKRGPTPRRCVSPMKTNIKVKNAANSAASPSGTREANASSLATQEKRKAEQPSTSEAPARDGEQGTVGCHGEADDDNWACPTNMPE